MADRRNLEQWRGIVTEKLTNLENTAAENKEAISKLTNACNELNGLLIKIGDQLKSNCEWHERHEKEHADAKKEQANVKIASWKRYSWQITTIVAIAALIVDAVLRILSR